MWKEAAEENPMIAGGVTRGIIVPIAKQTGAGV